MSLKETIMGNKMTIDTLQIKLDKRNELFELVLNEKNQLEKQTQAHKNRVLIAKEENQLLKQRIELMKSDGDTHQSVLEKNEKEVINKMIQINELTSQN